MLWPPSEWIEKKHACKTQGMRKKLACYFVNGVNKRDKTTAQAYSRP